MYKSQLYLLTRVTNKFKEKVKAKFLKLFLYCENI